MSNQLDQIISLAVFAGELMLKNGAETYRVEETMEHIARSCGAAQVESFVTPTGVFLTVIDESGRSQTTMRRIRLRTINLDRISKVNELSHRLADQRTTMAEAKAVLERVARERTGFSLGPSMAASGIVGGGTAFLQDAGSFEISGAFVAAAFIRYIAHIINRLQGVSFVGEFLGGMTAAATGTVLNYYFPWLKQDAIIIGGIMPLVPGMAITNAIRDVMAGDLISGMTRGMDAALTAVAVAMGVMIVLLIRAGGG